MQSRNTRSKAVETPSTPANESHVMLPDDNKYTYIPTIEPTYFPWGHYQHILQVIKAKKFYPLWITGMSGNGKTQMIEQACAEAGREFVRVNFTVETDENDLLGGQRLVNGDTVFHEGPIVTAMRRGAVLLLDEIDVGHTNKIMCLQSVLEGKGALIKATGEYVRPATLADDGVTWIPNGFTVFATSNTKGQGSEDGRFIGTNIMNAAFLDRFAGMLYQEYPNNDDEEQILRRYFVKYMWSNRTDANQVADTEMNDALKFIAKLVEWAAQTRMAFKNQAVEEVITTRTLINIIQGYSIFNDKVFAMTTACERYNDHTKEKFLSMFTKITDDMIITDDGKMQKEKKDAKYDYYS